MHSQIAAAIKLKRQPVAVLRTESVPEGALQFQPGKWGCVIAMLVTASKGRTAAFTLETTSCPGGRVGMGFGTFQLGVMEYFLSTGGVGPKAGEFYKKTPELAKGYLCSIPPVEQSPCVVLKPLDAVTEAETPEAVIFLVNADQLSGLVTLANYDSPDQDNVQVRFASGCVQAIRWAVSSDERDSSDCMIGLTDPSARKCVDKELLSFSIPYRRFLEMEDNVAGSFLTKETWSVIASRIGESDGV